MSSLGSCGQANKESKIEYDEQTKGEMLEIVKKSEKRIGDAIRANDSTLLAKIYSDSAYYVIHHCAILEPEADMLQAWGGFLRLKEKPIDLVLNIKDVRENRQIVYELGKGYAFLIDSTKRNFNYINSRTLQTDGSYRLDIDIYN